MHQNVDWLKSFYPPGFSLVFARDLEPGEILARLGCPPEAHRFMTVEDADDHAAEQSDDRELFRAGTAGEWSFAVQPWGARILNDDAAVARVSQGTEIVVLVNTSTMPWFAHAIDGAALSSPMDWVSTAVLSAPQPGL
ncbi:DUF6461 domain-containing protein [Streptomyces cyaneofuscatus]